MTKAVLLLFVISVVSVSIDSATVLPKDLKFQLHSGDLMPLVGLGTGRIKGVELVTDVLDRALEAGYRLIDTAKLYGNEEDIGKALKEVLPKHNLTRKDIWITTKLSFNDHGEKAYAALQESVRKLDAGYVDLYLIHWPGISIFNRNQTENNAKLRDESWKQLVKGVKDGLARNIGVSNYLLRHLKPLLENDHGIKPAVNQVEFHPYYHPQDLLDYCRKEGILLQAYSSLGGIRQNILQDPKITEIAQKLGKSNAQVLLRWSLQQNIAIIPKARSKKHLDENIELDFTIPEEDMETLSNFPIQKLSWNPETVA